jgi:hypothetical protein
LITPSNSSAQLHRVHSRDDLFGIVEAYLHRQATQPSTANMFRTTVLFLAIGLGLATSAQYTATVKTSVVKLESAPWKKLSNEQFAINYPGDWLQEFGGLRDLSALFLSPVDSGTAQPDRVEVKVGASEGRTLATVAASGLAELGERLSDVRELHRTFEGEVEMREYEAHMAGVHMRIKRQYRVQGDRIYVLTYMAEPRHYEEGLYMADAMFASFTIK